MTTDCALFDAWIQAPLDAGRPDATPSDDLVAHIQACPRCRGMLVMLFTQSAEVPTQEDAADHAHVEASLAAFVDEELVHGLAAAARSFPEIWWHTLVCRSCDELYRDLRDLAALPPIPRPALTRERTGKLLPQLRIQVPAGVLLGLVAARQSLGAALGGADELMLGEDEADEVSIRVSLRQGLDGSTQLVVRSAPRIKGTAVLSLGEYVFREPLDAEGNAVFPNLPMTLLNDYPATLVSVMIDQVL